MTKTSRKAREALGVGNRIAPWRFLAFLAVLTGGFFAYRAVWSASNATDGVAMAFDGAATVFLASLIPLLRCSSPESMREHAAMNDANRPLILVVTSLLTIVALAAIAGELDGARHGQLMSIVKLVGTLLLIWLFANSVYALHYAHAYYTHTDETDGDAGGLEFPDTKTPGYDDFMYFAFTLGMTFQTSDTDITASGIRRVALLHSFAAYLFSIGLIAFSINVIGGGG